MLLGVTAAAIILWSSRDSEPYYHGRSLSSWLVAYQEANQSYPANPAPAEAIRRIGSRATPYLLTWLHYQRPAWQQKLASALNKAPRPMTRVTGKLSDWLWSHWAKEEARSRAALWGFGVLGEAARDAAPQLGKFARGDGTRAKLALRALQEMGTNAEPAVAGLVLTLSRTNAQEVAAAAYVLACLKLRPDLAVPALAKCAHDRRGVGVRLAVLEALDAYREAARPLVEVEFHDPDETVRALAESRFNRF